MPPVIMFCMVDNWDWLSQCQDSGVSRCQSQIPADETKDTNKIHKTIMAIHSKLSLKA